MRITLEKRSEYSATMALFSPFVALGLTIVAGGIIFALRGLNPLEALYVYFVEPLTAMWSIQQIIVKATPLVLIGAGLSVCYTANVWNIGAEGQLTAGAILGGMVPVFFPAWQSPLKPSPRNKTATTAPWAANIPCPMACTAHTDSCPRSWQSKPGSAPPTSNCCGKP